MDADMLDFSIVVPTYARPERLANCLQAMTQLDYPRHCFEVIVVDDGSVPPIEPVVTPFKEQLNLTLIRQNNAGPATARNTGAAAAKGKFLVFTDDDCAPQPDWLRVLAAQLNVIPDCLVGGQTVNSLAKNLYSTASQILINYLYDYYNREPDQASFFASNNFGMSRSQFHEIGGFSTTFPLAAGEDREFCDRWLQHGYSMRYVPEAEVRHFHHLTLKSFWRQHFNYGRGAFHFHQIRAQRNASPIKVEPISFYLNLLTYPIVHLRNWQALPASVLLFISQIANVAGFFWERNMNRERQVKQLQPNS